MHHLLPQSIFHDRKFDTDNAIPLFKDTHPLVHKEHANVEFAIDLIMPVIETLETSFMEAK